LVQIGGHRLVNPVRWATGPALEPGDRWYGLPVYRTLLAANFIAARNRSAPFRERADRSTISLARNVIADWALFGFLRAIAHAPAILSVNIGNIFRRSGFAWGSENAQQGSDWVSTREQNFKKIKSSMK
jgi:hypothetical protein